MTTNEQAAANARALLAQCTVNGKVNHKQFIAEMQSRAMEHNGKPLTKSQLGLLGKIAAAYEQEMRV